MEVLRGAGCALWGLAMLVGMVAAVRWVARHIPWKGVPHDWPAEPMQPDEGLAHLAMAARSEPIACLYGLVMGVGLVAGAALPDTLAGSDGVGWYVAGILMIFPLMAGRDYLIWRRSPPARSRGE
jgi:hypothetical protein